MMGVYVYAGDDDLRNAGLLEPAAMSSSSSASNARRTPTRSVRICTQLNFANAAPWRLALVTTDAAQLVIDVELRGIGDALAEFIRRKLLQQTCVTRVDLYVPG